AHGVDILTDAEVVAVARDGVSLAYGSVVSADAVLVGVGALACDALARSAGLTCDDGVVVDAEARTSDPAIFAIGDMTRR
ncbi:FAD-dependent oxidoreductase, partial [Klebsiella pneumoniae]|nr:FAD-dependent oxidoreductase [Klebsiella pneumoniae]